MELIRNNIDRIESFKERLKESSYEFNKILSDKKTGTVETYEGKYLVRKNYKDGVQHGLHERVHPSGQVMSRGTYFNGQPHGLYEGFQVTGEVLYEWNYHHGKLHGQQRNYYDNGMLKRTEEHHKGEPLGEFVWYYDNGQVKRRGSMIGIYPSGIWETFSRNGVRTGRVDMGHGYN